MSRSILTFLPKNKQVAGMAIGGIAMLAMVVPALTQEALKKDEVFTLTTAIAVPGTTASNPFFSFDISWVDPDLKKYFLADRNNKAIDVVDPTTHQITQFVNPAYAGFTGNNDTSGPDGVLTVPKANTQSGAAELWVGDSPGRVWVINANNGTILTPTPISVGGTTRADELCFDAKDNLIMIASPGEDPPFVTFISTTDRKVKKQLLFNGGTDVMGLKATNGLEQCGWSKKTGLFYQNVPAVNGTPGQDDVPGAVAVIDPKTMKVVNSFTVPFDDCAGPQGMAIGPNNQILLGCNAASTDGHRNTVIINANSGAVTRTFADLGGADQVWFNEGDGHYFIPACNTACRAVPSTGQEVLGVVDSNGRRLDQSVVIASTTTTTGTGAARRIHSTAADPDTNQVFLPIPAIGGVQPTYAPTICSSAPKKVGSPTDAGGCIAIFATTHDDRSSVAQERGPDAHQE